MKPPKGIESLVRGIATVVSGDPDVALALVAKAASKGQRQITLPKAWAARPYRVTVFLTGRGSVLGRLIPEPECNRQRVREVECAPDCDRHAAF